MERTTVVMTHGFGSGLGFFYKNVDLLFDMYPEVDRVVLVDWIGMGGSDRLPIYPKKKRRIVLPSSLLLLPALPTTTEQAVNFFIEPFHEWFEQSIIARSPPTVDATRTGRENIILVGHSLGGYLCAQYAMKYPQHLSKLVLASPVGFSSSTTTTTTTTATLGSSHLKKHHRPLHHPNLFSENLYTHHNLHNPCRDAQHISNLSDVSSSIRSVSQSAEDATTTDAEGRNNAVRSNLNVTTATSTSKIDITNTTTNTIAAVMPSSKKSMIRILSTLWRSNVTPQQLIRMCGATHGRANVYRKLRQKLQTVVASTPNATTTTTTNTTSHDLKKGITSTVDAVVTSTPPTNVVHSDRDIQLLADYLYHITVADPSGEFAMNALLEPTLVTFVAMPPSLDTSSTKRPQEESSPLHHSESKSTTSAMMNEPSIPLGDICQGVIPLSKHSTNPKPSQASSGNISSFLFSKERTEDVAIHGHTTTTTVSSSDMKPIPRLKTYSAMGVSAREPLQELLAQTLDTSHGLHCVKVLYGSHDWMRPNETIARQSLEQLHQRTGIKTSVNVVPNVGHHLYIESPKEFVQQIMN
jgi:pimeloyl-ACP methyl ester carboxylesterase